jgi:hypothetical protein
MSLAVSFMSQSVGVALTALTAGCVNTLDYWLVPTVLEALSVNAPGGLTVGALVHQVRNPISHLPDAKAVHDPRVQRIVVWRARWAVS